MSGKSQLPPKASRLHEAESARADIIFIHGLGSSHKGAWGTNWKDWLPKDCPGANIWGVRYYAPIADVLHESNALPEIAESVLDCLEQQGIGDRPYCILAHSLGGLVAKQVLTRAAKTSGDAGISGRALGIVFYATPQRGARLASRGWPLRWAAGRQVAELVPGDKGVVDAHKEFLEFVSRRPGLAAEVLHETRPTRLPRFPLLRKLIVTKEEARLKGVRSTPVLQATHSEVSKPGSRDDPRYLHARTIIQGILAIDDPARHGELGEKEPDAIEVRITGVMRGRSAGATPAGTPPTPSTESQQSIAYWRHRLTAAVSPARALVIPGPSGRGKSFFMKQLRNALVAASPDSKHGWIGCETLAPTEKTFRLLMERFVPRNTSLGDEEFLASAQVEQILTGGGPLFFLYLDDLAWWRSEIEDQSSHAARFLKRVAGANSRLRLVATSRDPRLQKVLASLLGETNVHVPAHDRASGEAELAAFDDGETRAFLAMRSGISGRLNGRPADLKRLLQLAEGEPLTLRLLEDELDAVESDEWLEEILANGTNQPTAGAPVKDYLRSMLFYRQMNRLQSDARHALDCLAILRDPGFERVNHLDPTMAARAIERLTGQSDGQAPFLEDLLLQDIANFGDGSNQGQLTTRHDHAVRDLREHGIVTQDGLEFVLDAAHDYVLGLLDNGERKALHSRAAEASQHVGLDAHRVWHLIASGDATTAFTELMGARHGMQADFRYRHLRPIYEELRRAFWPGQDWRWAVVQVLLAETLYNGLDLEATAQPWDDRSVSIPTQTGPELVESAATILRRLIEYGSDCDADLVGDAFIRGNLLSAIYKFENPAKRDYRALIKILDDALDTIRKRKHKRFTPDPAVLANALTVKGCFASGGGQYTEACKAYEAACKTLEKHRKALGAHGRPEEVLRLDQDLLDTANDWSRARFLRDGPRAALGSARANGWQNFQEKVNGWTQIDREEYTYSLINICYYLLALGDSAGARQVLNKAYTDNAVSGIDRFGDDELKEFKDQWSEAYVDAIEAVLPYYQEPTPSDGLIDATVKRLQQCAERFRGWGFPRDARMMESSSQLILMGASPPNQRQAKVNDVVRSLRETDEPIATDMADYVDFFFGNPADKSSLSEGKAATLRRFPGLLKDPPPDESFWKPPIMMRGAITLRTHPCAPRRAELQASRGTR